MKALKFILICSGVTAATNIPAQEKAENDSTLNRTVVVENQYNPEVTDAFKINVLPDIEEPAVAKHEIDYATSIHPLTAWETQPMNAMLRNQSQKNEPRGYARAAYGNRGNVNLRGSYLWDISRNDRLGIMVSMYGRHGNIPYMTSNQPDWKSRFYRTDASLDYKHHFRQVSLCLGGSFASQVFNYMPQAETSEASSTGTSRQHYTLGEGYISLESNKDKLPVDFIFQTGLQRFDRKYPTPGLNHGAENKIHTTGYIAADINPSQLVGIGFQMDNLFHDASLPLNDFTLLQLNPYYMLKNGQIALRVGAHVDLQTANGSGLKAAPDFKLDYTFASSYTLFLHLTGNTRLNDSRQLNSLSPYWMPYSQLLTSYTPMNARIGLKASPVSDFGFKLEGGYRITKNELFALPGTADNSAFVYSQILQEKAKVAYGSMAFNYTCKDWIDLHLEGSYYSWDMTDEAEPLLYLKPQFSVDFGARAKITDNLHIALDYQYEGRKEIDGMKKADPVNNLCVGAEYELFGRVNVFARMNNLLNKYYLTENGYPMQGIYFMAGISCRF